MGYLKWAVAGGLLVALVGCGSNFGFPGVYRINVEQGNVVNEEMVEKLRPGLNKRQVRYIMGTPLIEDSFHDDRWDYRYLLRNGTTRLCWRHASPSGSKMTNWPVPRDLMPLSGPSVTPLMRRRRGGNRDDGSRSHRCNRSRLNRDNRS